MFGRGKSIVGIDIGSSSIKLVELRKVKKGLQLVHFRMVPLPSESIVDGAIMNSTAVVDALSELITQEKVKTKDVATSVCGHSVIVKKIKLPQMTEDELEESIQWEAEQYIPFDITDVNLDVQILGNDEQDVGQMEVLLVAAKKDMLNDYTAVLMEAGLNPIIMDVDAFAVENCFEMNYGVQQGTVVLANLGASVININILRNGVSTFTRDISMGGNQFTEEIQKQLNVSRDEAEALKLGGDSGGFTQEATEAVIPQEVGGIIRTISESMAAEVQRSLDFFAASAADDKIAKIYIMGGSAKVPGLASVLENKLGIPVEIANPFQGIEVDEKKFNSAHIQNIAPSAAVAVGLALRSVGDK